MLKGDIINLEIVDMLVDNFFEYWNGAEFVNSDIQSIIMTCPFITYAEACKCVEKIEERIRKKNE